MEVVKCPHCKSAVVGPPIKQWEVKLRVQKGGPKGTGKTGDSKRSNKAIISIYHCQNCDTKFRRGESKRD